MVENITFLLPIINIFINKIVANTKIKSLLRNIEIFDRTFTFKK